jgi:hypothetical protein
MRIMLAAAYTQSPTRPLRSAQPWRDRPLVEPPAGHRRRNIRNGGPDLGRG